jgi:hypothetical protein
MWNSTSRHLRKVGRKEGSDESLKVSVAPFSKGDSVCKCWLLIDLLAFTHSLTRSLTGTSTASKSWCQFTRVTKGIDISFGLAWNPLNILFSPFWEILLKNEIRGTQATLCCVVLLATLYIYICMQGMFVEFGQQYNLNVHWSSVSVIIIIWLGLDLDLDLDFGFGIENPGWSSRRLFARFYRSQRFCRRTSAILTFCDPFCSSGLSRVHHSGYSTT